MKPSRIACLGTGFLLGICAGWLTADRRGRELRAELAGKYRRTRRRAQRVVGAARAFGNRARGLVIEVEETIAPPDSYVDAKTLVDQVRSRLGRAFADALNRVNINGVGHTIHLHGTLDARERERLIAAIREIDGVEEVEAEHLRVA